jgi:hypothetical protein
MLWWLMAGLFGWLAFREIYYGYVPRPGFDRPNPQSSLWFAMVLALIAAAFAYTPVRYWLFERSLTQKAQILSENSQAHVHCNTVADTLFDQNVFAAGHAQFETGRIVFQYPWCARLMDHIKNPKRPTREERFSMQLFAHEAMHVRGERDEAKTECQAIQRFVRASMLFGIPEDLARANGMTYFLHDYRQRAEQGTMSAQYFSLECAPGKALDERLFDSTWR